MKESKIQADIIAFLEAENCHVFKIIKANRNGCPDILGVTSWGRMLAIEVKTPSGRTSALQSHHIAELRQRGAFAIVADSVEKVRLAWEAVLLQ